MRDLSRYIIDSQGNMYSLIDIEHFYNEENDRLLQEILNKIAALKAQQQQVQQTQQQIQQLQQQVQQMVQQVEQQKVIDPTINADAEIAKILKAISEKL